MNTALKIVPPAEGRTIHATIDIWITHHDPKRVGDIDAGLEIGKGLVRESMLLLENAARREGFEIEAKLRQVVY